MTNAASHSARVAAFKIITVYWALLAFGMVLYTAMRLDALSVLEPMWAGAIAGTAVGQMLAVRRCRTWLAVFSILAIATLVLPHAPPEFGGKRLLLAFVPAALCGFWSLGDRTTLASFWFPAVIWMLAILDGAHAGSLPDGNGLALFVGLVVMFLVFLRVREERRVALWRTVAPDPLASPRPHAIVRERPSVQLARGAWGVFVTGLALAATAWLAPSLWEPEMHDGDHVAISSQQPSLGVPCCPAVPEEATHTRVKEYFEIGRADVFHHASAPKDWRVCDDDDPAVGNWNRGGRRTHGFRRPDLIAGNGTLSQMPTQPEHTDLYQPIVVSGDAPTSSWQPPAVPTSSTQPPSSGTSITTSVPTAPMSAPAPSVDVHATRRQLPPPAQPVPARSPQAHAPQDVQAQVAYAPQQDAHAAAQEARPHLSSNTLPAVTHEATSEPVRSEHVGGYQLLHWIAVLLAAMFFVQLISLALRPLRRALVLRHLRHPFWTETVDQRISNAWQLVLVGLRDAGWRADSGEAPRELAKRVAIEGVEDCAEILDRARHGIRIDREDLDKMASSADAAYGGARTKVGRVARAVACLRWPLV
jgi:hypothetical protein